MTTKDFNAEVARDWRRGVAAGLLRARQAEIDDQVRALLNELENATPAQRYLVSDEILTAVEAKPAHLDRCACGQAWTCTDQHITSLDSHSIPVWNTIPAGETFTQLRCLLCADPFEGFK